VLFEHARATESFEPPVGLVLPVSTLGFYDGVVPLGSVVEESALELW
jgi:hypothetical protein